MIEGQIMATQKSLIIHGPINDLGDLLQIARAQGCKILGCDKVTVDPHVFSVNNDYVVLVSPKGVVVQNTEVVSVNSRNKT